ncbi:hypothetical protein T439DRAFT_322953 [Meredithblackwellia eburnea MCA 4105]
MARSPSVLEAAPDDEQQEHDSSSRTRSGSLSPSPSDIDHHSSPEAITSLPQELDNASSTERVSFYVQAVEQMLEACVAPTANERHLFTHNEQQALNRFEQLDYQARYLFVRLYLRKHSWIRTSTIGYESDIGDLNATVRALTEEPIPVIELNSSPPPEVGTSASATASTPSSSSDCIDLTMESDSDSEDSKSSKLITQKKPDIKGKGRAKEEDEDDADFTRFALDESVLVNTASTELLLSLLTMEEIVALGIKMKVKAGKNTRRDITQALLKTGSQSTLSFIKTTPASSKNKGKAKTSTGTLGVGFDEKGNKLKQSSVIRGHALKIIGPCIKLSQHYVSLFDRLSLLYHRTAYVSPNSGTTSLTASLLAKFGKRTYPEYKVGRTFSIFPSRDVLCRFERALGAEREMEELLSYAWKPPASTGPKKNTDGVGETPTKKRQKPMFRADVAAGTAPLTPVEAKEKEQRERWLIGVEIYNRVKGDWEASVEEGKLDDEKETDEHKKALLYYRKRFHPGWPLTRVLYKSAHVFARLGQHDQEMEILKALLSQHSFRRGKRGAWYERLALVMMKPTAKEKDDSLSKEKKERLVKKRLERALEVCLKGLDDPYTHLIYHSSLQRRIKRIESMLQVDKLARRKFNEGSMRAASRVMIGLRLDDPTIGKKSCWQGDEEELGVEAYALERYADDDWKGFHSENGILTMIFALCFWDILFADVDGVFETSYQAAPLDLATDAFALVRAPQIKKRLNYIERGGAAKLIAKVNDRERPKSTWCVGVNWEKYSKEDLLEIVECINGEGLAFILRMFTEEYGHRTGGIPDLCLWNPKERRIMFSEVKGPGDFLSETQKVWIDVLLQAGVEVEVCHVMTQEMKDKKDDLAKMRAEKSKEKKRAKSQADDSDEGEH